MWFLVIFVFCYSLLYAITLWLKQNKFAAIFIFLSGSAVLALPLIIGMDMLNV